MTKQHLNENNKPINGQNNTHPKGQKGVIPSVIKLNQGSTQPKTQKLFPVVLPRPERGSAKKVKARI